ncbi:MAG: WhiB family transcriptional regulator [Egibacteraceae bacterium]
MEDGMALTAEEFTEFRYEFEHPPLRRRRERDTAWHKAALCAEFGPRLHYAEDEEPAKTLCRPCPARLDCLAHALDFREELGVWGGLGPLEFEELRAELMPPPPAEAAPAGLRLRPELPAVLPEEERIMEHEVAALEDYRRAVAAMERGRLEFEAATELRREALARLYAQGLTITELSRRLGISRSRVSQLLELRATG